jgi:NAD(P)H dehydrogenase (quinone)
LQKILIIYYSRHGGTTAMAEHIGSGVDASPGCEAIIRRLPEVSATTEQTTAKIPEHGVPYAETGDLKECDGLIIGSPGYFGNMAAPLKYFFDQTSQYWLSGEDYRKSRVFWQYGCTTKIFLRSNQSILAFRGVNR